MGKNDKTKAKKKKEKIVYIDDGSTIADMSAIKGKKPGNTQSNRYKETSRHRSTVKEQFETYIGAVKMMFLPMLVVLGVIAIAYLILYIILSL